MKNLNILTENKIRPTVLAMAMSLSVVLTGCKSEVETHDLKPVVRPVFVELASEIKTADLSFNGTIQSASRAELSFRNSGRLIEMLVQEGDYVEKGQLIALLDAVDAKIAKTSAKIERDNAHSEYQRAKKLFDSRQSISKSQFEELTLRFELAQNRFLEASRRLDDTNLKAPFSGVVSRTYVDNHVLVESNEPIVSLHDLNNLEVVIDVPESLMTRNREVGQIFAQSTIAPYEAFELSLKKYETEPDPVSGTYAVTFAVDTKEKSGLLPGMNVHVYSNAVSSEEKSIHLPLSAVNPDNLGNQFIWVVDDNNTLRKRTVMTGALNGDRVEIVSELHIGEQVVISGTTSLQEGLMVSPQTVEAY